MEKLKGIIFDFDGVICESVEAKTDAMRMIFRDYPQHIDKIVKLHMDNGGMSRYTKFEIIYKTILKKELTPELSAKLGRLFTEYSHDEVVSSPYVKGAEEFLSKHHQHLKLFVASGTPQEEMDAVVDDRGMRHFFKEVYGAPRLKHELISVILSDYQLKADEVMFVGDSINDLDGARRAGVYFIGRVHERYDNPFTDVPQEDLIGDLSELESIIKRQFEFA